MTSLNEFAKSLTDKYGLSDNDALNFLKEMFAVITDELRNGSDATSVKVKGLGTFRMQSVNPRVSVDVNTGERILIDGRYKIVFTPEAMLRDRVNSPFAQFETFVVNEGIDFSQVDEEENEGITSLEETSSDDVPSDEILSEDIPSEPPVPGSRFLQENLLLPMNRFHQKNLLFQRSLLQKIFRKVKKIPMIMSS